MWPRSRSALGSPERLRATGSRFAIVAINSTASRPFNGSPTDCVPPQDLDAERSVLGAILLKNEAIKEILEMLAPEDFYRGAHRYIYRAMRTLAMDNETIDAVLLSRMLADKGKLEAIGGAAFLPPLWLAVPRARDNNHYPRLPQQN